MGIEVRVTEHGPADQFELFRQGAELLEIVDALPKEDVALVHEAAVALTEKPGQILVVLVDGLHELSMYGLA